MTAKRNRGLTEQAAPTAVDASCRMVMASRISSGPVRERVLAPLGRPEGIHHQRVLAPLRGSYGASGADLTGVVGMGQCIVRWCAIRLCRA